MKMGSFGVGLQKGISGKEREFCEINFGPAGPLKKKERVGWVILKRRGKGIGFDKSGRKIKQDDAFLCVVIVAGACLCLEFHLLEVPYVLGSLALTRYYKLR
ncbi:hypothetical protein V6N12_039215 [Hibiscus sabdariffa]|uniref:G-patch domain-containing protein n=1 Tax=Hibiscus sabdariffa TaxID=183260 RepID=A0ABR2E024_9ROSI